MSLQPFSQFGPLVTAMVTQFKPSGEVDYTRAEELAAHLIENGTTGLVLSGTTGESPTLSPTEKLELFRVVKKAVGSTPVVANTGDNETSFSVEMTKQAEKVGVDAILLVVPYYNKPSQEGLFQHFKTIAEATALPCVLYNVPARTSRNMDANTTARLSEISNIIGTKEASGDFDQIASVRAKTADEFQIYSGNDSDTLPMLTLGACGVVSVLSHIAGNEIRAMMDAFWSGDINRARELHLQLLPVVSALFPPSTPSPAPVKAALQLRHFDCGGLRLPLVECTQAERDAVQSAMENAGLL
jgi:4-hydroxy-tetrahydrodipicolinate synthase